MPEAHALQLGSIRGEQMGQQHALVVTNRDAGVATTWRNAAVVRTLLDMVTCLEQAREAIATVILGGDFARDREIAVFLREAYPGVDVQCFPGGSRR